MQKIECRKAHVQSFEVHPPLTALCTCKNVHNGKQLFTFIVNEDASINNPMKFILIDIRL